MLHNAEESHVSVPYIKSAAFFWLKPAQKSLALAGSVTCNLILQGTVALCCVTEARSFD